MKEAWEKREGARVTCCIAVMPPYNSGECDDKCDKYDDESESDDDDDGGGGGECDGECDDDN